VLWACVVIHSILWIETFLFKKLYEGWNLKLGTFLCGFTDIIVKDTVLHIRGMVIMALIDY